MADPPVMMSQQSRHPISDPGYASNASNQILTAFLENTVSDNASEDDSSVVSCHGIQCYPNSFFYAATAATVLLALVGAFGNILTVVAIWKSNLRKNINSILICNLSFADALYCTFLLPLQATAFFKRDWVIGEALCELHASMRLWLIGVNMCLLSCIAFYRFLNVVHPQTHTCLSLRPWFATAVLICWLMPLCFVFTPLVNAWGSYEFIADILQCTFSPGGSVSHKITVITLGYVIPCLFISVCYSRIGCVVFNSRKRSARGSIYRRQRAKRESFRLTAMMVLIFLGFLFGTTPYFLINILDRKLTLPAAHIWFPVLAWVMYSLTPVIYTIMDAKFQEAYRRLLFCQVKRNETLVLGETSCHEHKSSPLTSNKSKHRATLIIRQ